ncbi:MAG TPA: hypothetical protein VKA03_03865 [Methylovirgula sp.]|nr:hypothetical protein [Methylovirgula sp.]
MTLSIFGYLIADAESPPGSTGAPRLRDLIVGLLSGDIAAATILGRLDPNLSDEVRAMVAHRGMTAESFLANALMAFAFDVADESWRQAIKYREPIAEDAEAEAFADLLKEAMRQRLEREVYLGRQAESSEPHMPLGRRIG